MDCKFDFNNQQIKKNGACPFNGECVKILQEQSCVNLAEEINKLTHKNKYKPSGSLLYTPNGFVQKMLCTRFH